MIQKTGCSLEFTVVSIGLAIILWLVFKLPSVILTRIGTFLELIAAFLVAPELLGAERIAWIEESARAVADWLWARTPQVARCALFVAPGAIGFPLRATLLYILVGGLSGWWMYGILRSLILTPIMILTRQVVPTGDLPLTPIAWRRWLTTSLSTTCALSSADLIPLGVFLLISSLNNALAESRELYERIDRREPAARLILDISNKLLWITLFPGHFLIGITNLFIGFPAAILSRIARRLRLALRERGRIVKLMVPLGIAAFVVGMIYQIIGTL